MTNSPLRAGALQTLDIIAARLETPIDWVDANKPVFKSYSLDYLRTAAAVALVIASFFMYRHHSRPFFIAPLILAPAVFYSAVKTDLVINPAYHETITSITKTLNELIEDINSCRHKNEKKIIETFRGKAYSSLRDLETDISELKEKLLQGRDYQPVKSLSYREPNNLRPGHPLQPKLVELVDACKKFVNGNQTGASENFCYVHYSIKDGKAVIHV